MGALRGSTSQRSDSLGFSPLVAARSTQQIESQELSFERDIPRGTGSLDSRRSISGSNKPPELDFAEAMLRGGGSQAIAREQPLAGTQVAGVPVRDHGLNPVFHSRIRLRQFVLDVRHHGRMSMVTRLRRVALFHGH